MSPVPTPCESHFCKATSDGFSSTAGVGEVSSPKQEPRPDSGTERKGFIVYQLTASWRIICGSAAGLAVLGEIGDWRGR